MRRQGQTIGPSTGLLIGALALGAAGTAQANLFDVFGAGARSTAMAGAGAGLATDATATWHNPAGLALGTTSISFGVIGHFNRTSILLKPRPTGYDPPRYGVGLNPRSHNEHPAGSAGFKLGFNLKLFNDDLALGGLVLLPVDGVGFVDTWFADEREQNFTNQLHFELLGNRLSKEVISFGLGYRLREWLSMGAGVMILPASTTRNSVYTPNATDPSDVELNLAIKQSARWAITAGLIWTPLEWLNLAVNFQDEIWFGVEGGNRVLLRGEEEEPIQQVIDVVSGFTPPRLTGAVTLIDADGLTGTLEGTWRAWSRYRDQHGARTHFNDVIEWKLGAEWALNEATFVRVGAAYSPTPIPKQDGRTNYVDNDRVILSAGAGRDFEVLGETLTLDLGLQLHALLSNDVDKAIKAEYPPCAPGETALCDEVTDDSGLFFDPRAAEGLQTGNPGFPGYTHGGYIVSAGLDLKWRF